MTATALGPTTTLATEADVLAFARATADEVHDPCGMAMGVRIGLAEMGLIRAASANRGPDGWNVQVQLRLTSPGCQYFFFFQDDLEDRLTRHPEIVSASVLWDQTLDWTPEDMAPTAQLKLEARRQPISQRADS